MDKGKQKAEQSRIGQFMGNGMDVKKANTNPSQKSYSMKSGGTSNKKS